MSIGPDDAVAVPAGAEPDPQRRQRQTREPVQRHDHTRSSRARTRRSRRARARPGRARWPGRSRSTGSAASHRPRPVPGAGWYGRVTRTPVREAVCAPGRRASGPASSSRAPAPGRGTAPAPGPTRPADTASSGRLVNASPIAAMPASTRAHTAPGPSAQPLTGPGHVHRSYRAHRARGSMVVLAPPAREDVALLTTQASGRSDGDMTITMTPLADNDRQRLRRPVPADQRRGADAAPARLLRRSAERRHADVRRRLDRVLPHRLVLVAVGDGRVPRRHVHPGRARGARPGPPPGVPHQTPR